MIDYDYWIDHIGIFYANLTWFYILSMIISWLTFALSSWKNLPFSKNKKVLVEENTVTEEPAEESLQTQYKLARQKLIEQDLTPKQRSEEKELRINNLIHIFLIEAQQLAAIFKLLQEKSETFQVASMDQLEDQLRLYRK